MKPSERDFGFNMRYEFKDDHYGKGFGINYIFMTSLFLGKKETSFHCKCNHSTLTSIVSHVAVTRSFDAREILSPFVKTAKI